MPTVTEAPTTAYAHCRDSRCAGNEQEMVEAVRVEEAYTMRDLGDVTNTPMSNVIERSNVRWKFANAEDSPCPECGLIRDLGGSPRPTYAPLSGFDPDGLLGSKRFDKNVVNSKSDQELAEAKAQIAALEAKMDTLLNAITGEETEKGKDE